MFENRLCYIRKSNEAEIIENLKFVKRSYDIEFLIQEFAGNFGHFLTWLNTSEHCREEDKTVTALVELCNGLVVEFDPSYLVFLDNDFSCCEGLKKAAEKLGNIYDIGSLKDIEE